MSMLLKSGYFLYGSADSIMVAYEEYGRNLANLHFYGIKQNTYEMSSLVLAKNSPWTEILNEGLIRLRQTGQLDQLFKTWLVGMDLKLSNALDATTDGVEIGQVIWAFVGLLGALIIALISFTVEKLMRKRKAIETTYHVEEE